jgi:hypothetical protein
MLLPILVLQSAEAQLATQERCSVWTKSWLRTRGQTACHTGCNPTFCPSALLHRSSQQGLPADNVSVWLKYTQHTQTSKSSLMYSNGSKQDDDNSSQVCYPITKSPHQPHCSTIIHIWPAPLFCKLTVITGTGKLLLLYIPQTSCYFCCIFLRSDHIVGQDQESWTSDTGKRHIKEQYIQCNYTLLIWVICCNQKKWNIVVGKQCLWEQKTDLTDI